MYNYFNKVICYFSNVYKISTLKVYKKKIVRMDFQCFSITMRIVYDELCIRYICKSFRDINILLNINQIKTIII